MWMIFWQKKALLGLQREKSSINVCQKVRGKINEKKAPNYR